jgi:hypothetical protein
VYHIDHLALPCTGSTKIKKYQLHYLAAKADSKKKCLQTTQDEMMLAAL